MSSTPPPPAPWQDPWQPPQSPGPAGPPAPPAPPAPPLEAAPYDWGGSASAHPRTDAIAVAGFVTAFVAPVVGLVLSLVGLRRTARAGTGGRGLAVAGVVLGGAGTLLSGLVLAGAALYLADTGPTGPVAGPAGTPVDELPALTGASAGGDVDAYLTGVEAADADLFWDSDDVDLVTWGELVCDDLQQGLTPAATTSDLVDASGLTSRETEAIVVPATASLCPAHPDPTGDGTGGRIDT